MERVPFQQDLSGMSCLVFPGRLLHSCTGSPWAGSSQMCHCTSIIFPEGFWICESPLCDFWNSSKKTFENLKIHFTSLCCTFSTCHLWELETAQMGKPGGSEIPALLNEKRLGSQLRHSTRSVHSAVILACSIVQSWCVPPSCDPENILVWLWGYFIRVTPQSQCRLHYIRFCTCPSMFSDFAFWNVPHTIPSSPSPELSTYNLVFRLYKHSFAGCNTAPALFSIPWMEAQHMLFKS